MPLLGTTKAHQSAKPDAPLSTKASRYTNHQLDQKHADNPIGKILPFPVLKVLSISAVLTFGATKPVNLFCSYPETTHADSLPNRNQQIS
jgi:hypothetical protein